MVFKDLDVYLQVARALLEGHNPYAVPEAYYPLPFYFIFVPLSLLPLPLAHGIWTFIEAVVLVAILRRRAMFALFFMPVILTFLMGQIDIPMLGVLALLRSGIAGGLALGLLFLKPQLVIFLAPWQLWRWWSGQRRQLALFALTLAVLGLSAFLVDPRWLVNWLALSGERLRAPLSPSVWGALAFIPPPTYFIIAGAMTLLLLAWGYRRNDFNIVNVVGFLVNPVIISYDLTLLTLGIRGMRAWLVMIVVSWLSFGISAFGWWRGEGPFVLTTLIALSVILFEKRNRIAFVSSTKSSGAAALVSTQ